MVKTDPRVDDKIAQAPAFAQPVMRHLRALVHSACPDAEETIKWSRAVFLDRGRMVCMISSFKEHCGFGFFGPEMDRVMAEAGMPAGDASGSVGRIRSMADLPGDEQLLLWIREAARLAGAGAPLRAPRTSGPRPAPETPPDLEAALAKVGGAKANFSGLSPSCRREYTEWITEAKRPETRERRVAQAVAWIAEGRTRSWRYGG